MILPGPPGRSGAARPRLLFGTLNEALPDDAMITYRPRRRER